MTFLPQILQESVEGNRAEFSLHVPKDLAHFPGHFPGQPLLPGVVEIDWAVRLAQRHFTLPTRHFSALKGLKFTSPVLPGVTLKLVLLWWEEKSRLDFAYSAGERPCAAGQVLFAGDAA
ncbi:MAG: hypothetical protein ACM3SV_11480 [Betaproteobacteria bacterium]